IDRRRAAIGVDPGQVEGSIAELGQSILPVEHRGDGCRHVTATGWNTIADDNLVLLPAKRDRAVLDPVAVHDKLHAADSRGDALFDGHRAAHTLEDREIIVAPR